jgi:hypothetical protein
MALTGKQLSELIARRKERQKIAKLEAHVGECEVNLFSSLVKLHCGEPGWPTEAEIQAEIERSRKRRQKA